MNATPTRQYNTVLSQAKKGVPGFALAYGKFIEKVAIRQKSKSQMNYDVDQCPCCKKARPDDLVGRGRRQAILHFDANAPPPVWVLKKMATQKSETAQ